MATKNEIVELIADALGLGVEDIKVIRTDYNTGSIRIDIDAIDLDPDEDDEEEDGDDDLDVDDSEDDE